MDSRPTVLFVELEGWELQHLRGRGRGKWTVHTRTERFEDIPEAQLPRETSILSPFVYSRCSERDLERLPHLRLIATRSTGFDHIDLEYCRSRGIVVSNVPTYGDNTVAEHTFGLILALTRKIHRAYERTVRGDFSSEGLRGSDLQGKTFGCVGTGNIGLNVLRIARGFDMRRLAYDVRPNPKAAEELGFEYVDFGTLLSHSHVLSLHVPYNRRTHHLMNAEAIAKMRPGAILVNTSRGGVVDAQAMIQALRAGHLGGAALDVLEGEAKIGEEAELLTHDSDSEMLKAVVRNHALLRMANVIITPHVAFNSIEAVMRILDTTTENIKAFLAGRPQNVVELAVRRTA